MTTIDIGTEGLRTELSGRSSRALRGGFLRVTGAVAQRWETRKAMAMLGKADGAMLKDLGITRSGIEGAIRHGRR